MSRSSAINHYIDHTLLKPDATAQQIKQLCVEASKHQFKSVCVPPVYVTRAVEFVKNTNVEVCTVVGFPHGYSHSSHKVMQTIDAIEEGADEIDMVVSIAEVKNGNFDIVQNDIQLVLNTCAYYHKTIKVIIETALLSQEEKETVIKLCNEVLSPHSPFIHAPSGEQRYHFVKTSTGFAGGGATTEDVRLMRKLLDKNIHIKASGGIKTPNFARELIEAGATRLGASSSIDLIQ